MPAAPLPYGRRVAPRRTLAHLVLPAQRLRAVRSVLRRVRARDTVQGEWKMQSGSSRGGVRALFAGPPGTGKTLAAEAVAGELGRDLYVIDLSMVVSKYIGETEKALSTIFTEAARCGVCLFFDEADALFVKRTSVRDAHDRYANIETAYLLQAIDDYPDVVLMATNILTNVDEAMLRRVDVLVEFPMPDAPARRRLWHVALAGAPLDGVDLDRLAERFILSGGAIQSAALTAAYDAAAESRAIGTLDLLRAARDEFTKSGKVAGRMELGDHYDALMAEG
jgi:SpoVK/Ycf46/Vps4 family AAA+-type ATPase